MTLNYDIKNISTALWKVDRRGEDKKQTNYD